MLLTTTPSHELVEVDWSVVDLFDADVDVWGSKDVCVNVAMNVRSISPQT